MTNLNLIRDILTYSEGYSAEVIELFQSALEEITELREKVLAFGGFSPADTAHLVTECGKSSQQLVHFECSTSIVLDKFASMRIALKHHACGVILEQEITLTHQRGVWAAQAVITNFPECDSPEAAMDKLADWLMRLGLAAQVGPAMRDTLRVLWKKD